MCISCVKWPVCLCLCFAQLTPLETLTQWWRGNEASAFLSWSQWETVSRPSRQTNSRTGWKTDRKRNWVDNQEESENLQSGRQTDKHAGSRPDGQVETRRWSQPVPPNDHVTQTENKEGEEKEKHCYSCPQTPAPPHSFLASLSVTLSFTFLSGFSLFFISFPIISGALLSYFSVLTSLSRCCNLRTLNLYPFTTFSHSLYAFSTAVSLSVCLWGFFTFFLPPVWTGSQADRGSFVTSEAWLCDNEDRRTVEEKLNRLQPQSIYSYNQQCQELGWSLTSLPGYFWHL